MACASFLKFHPTLPKQGTTVVTRNSQMTLDRRHRELTKEERARQRHSVEVTNAGNYLHIQPSTLESLTRSAANASANRNRRKQSENFGYQTISVLPPALKSLVYLWEEVTSNCLVVVSQQIIPTSPIQNRVKKHNKNGSDAKLEGKEKYEVNDKGNKKCKKKKVPSRNYLGM